MKSLKINITGRVQGVGYRFYALQKAQEHNIYGWVKNEMDSSVTVTACGESDKLELFIESLKTGPSLSRVDEIKILESSETILYSDFSIIR